MAEPADSFVPELYAKELDYALTATTVAAQVCANNYTIGTGDTELSIFAGMRATLEIPQGVLDAAQMNTQELRRELALALYAQGRLSLGKARELAGLSLWEFRQWLGLRRIEAHYDTAEVRDDIATLRALGRLP